MSSTTRSLRWRLGDGETCGLEHLELKISEAGVAAEAVVIGGRGDATFGARWRITVDPDWACTRSLHLTRLGGATVALRHDGYGEWSDGEGKRRKEFQGLSDCLVAGSSFGITQLLKRLGAKAAKAQVVDVVLVTQPGLEVARASLALRPIEPGRVFRLTVDEAESEIEVDADGFVTRWGETATRIESTPVDA